MGFVRSKTFGVGVTILIIAGVIFLAKKTNLGDFIAGGLKGFGTAAGKSLVAPITGLVEGVTVGGRELFGAAGTAGADVQEAFTGNRNAIVDWFANLGGNGGGTNGGGVPPQNPFDAEGQLFDFSSILKAFPTLPGQFTQFTQPVVFASPRRDSSGLTVTGVSGVNITGQSIRGTPIAPTAISLSQQTLTGINNRGQPIRGSAALFERLRQNIQGG